MRSVFLLHLPFLPTATRDSITAWAGAFPVAAAGTANVRVQPSIPARVRDVMWHPDHTDEVIWLLLTYPCL
jgi:hypothetical protein